VLVNAHGDRTTRKLRSSQIEVAGDGDRSRIEFEWPADVKGTRMLTWTHRKGNDDQWLFLPAINRVKRVSSGNRSGAFMGSEFAYEDLGSQHVGTYAERLLAGPLPWTRMRQAYGLLRLCERYVTVRDSEPRADFRFG
jgi:hypothetical protein